LREWARNKGAEGKRKPLKGQFLSGANRRAVWLVDPKMLTLVQSTAPLILHTGWHPWDAVQS
jgi:hypothetical protein